jgi:hypothetical protein
MLSQFDEAGLYGFILAGGNNNGVQLNEILVRGKTIHMNRPSHFQFKEIPHANWSKLTEYIVQPIFFSYICPLFFPELQQRQQNP